MKKDLEVIVWCATFVLQKCDTAIMATKRKTTKTSPIGIRFDIEKLSFISERENLETKQQVVDFLMENYWWGKKTENNPAATKVGNVILSKPEHQKQIIKPELSTYEVYLEEIITATSVQSIEVTMAAVKAEKSLTSPEKTNLERLAKQKSTQFDF